jgi:F-type H+-transporting ATPase subunit delta
VSERRLGSQLDKAVDAAPADVGVAGELFAVADLLDDQTVLKRRLTELSLGVEGRRALAGTLFAGRLGEAAQQVVSDAVALVWPSANALSAGLRYAGVRLAWRAADAKGEVEAVRQSLASLIAAVSDSSELDAAIGEDAYPLGARQQLVADLLGKKAGPEAVLLAQQAVKEQVRGYPHVLQRYLDIAATLRSRLRATITTAIPLDAARQQKMLAELARVYDAAIDPVFKVNAAIVGGVRVDIGDEIIDGTVSTRLAEVGRTPF